LADITLSSRTMIRPYLSRAGQPLTLTRDASTCASTATIKVGQVVQFDIVSETASHRLVRASTAAGHPNLSTNIAGIAAASDASDGSTLSGEGARPLTFWAADPNTEFLFPTKIPGTASTLIGTNLALGYDSTLSIHYVMSNSTAGNQRVAITDVINPGDTNGLVVGRFLSTAVSPAVWAR
jgi:hypothetical protein